MSKCPYTWVKNLFAGKAKLPGEAANSLRVTVDREGDRKVDVALPARSARWLLEIIPKDVIEKIKAEGIPIEMMNQDLKERIHLGAQDLFLLNEPGRTVRVWLE